MKLIYFLLLVFAYSIKRRRKISKSKKQWTGAAEGEFGNFNINANKAEFLETGCVGMPNDGYFYVCKCGNINKEALRDEIESTTVIDRKYKTYSLSCGDGFKRVQSFTPRECFKAFLSCNKLSTNADNVLTCENIIGYEIKPDLKDVVYCILVNHTNDYFKCVKGFTKVNNMYTCSEDLQESGGADIENYVYDDCKRWKDGCDKTGEKEFTCSNKES